LATTRRTGRGGPAGARLPIAPPHIVRDPTPVGNPVQYPQNDGGSAALVAELAPHKRRVPHALVVLNQLPRRTTPGIDQCRIRPGVNQRANDDGLQLGGRPVQGRATLRAANDVYGRPGAEQLLDGGDVSDL